MAWDIALDNNFDWVLSANRDMAHVSGVNLLQQRIRTRLSVVRGQWVYDRSGTFGSRLKTLTQRTTELAEAEAHALVREALEDMDDVDILKIGIEGVEATGQLKVTVEFKPRLTVAGVTLPVMTDLAPFAVTTFF